MPKEAKERNITEVLDRNILALLEREPDLMEINQGIVRNEGYIKSLKEDQDYLRNKQNSLSVKNSTHRDT